MAAIAKATLQSCVINAASNVLAQGIQAYRAEIPFELDVTTLVQFTTSAFILSPLTFLWLEGLEASFPGETEIEQPANEKKTGKDKKGTVTKKERNITNTITKVLVDQLVGGVWMTVLYIVTISTLRGQAWESITNEIQQNFYPLLIAGFQVWPLVSILQFTVVPANKRPLVGSLFGFLWAVYLSLIS